MIKIIIILVHLSFYINAKEFELEINKLAHFQSVVASFATKFVPQPSDIGGKNGYFGTAMSIDGNRAIISGDGLAGYGAVMVYDFDGSVWQESATLKPSVRLLNERFGASISLSGDYALIGVKPDDMTVSGHAYLFKFSDEIWQQIQVLRPVSIQNNNEFGSSVSIKDGFALVGAPGNMINGLDAGTAHLFENQGDAWIEVETFFDNEGRSLDRFGHSVSIVSDRILVGAVKAENNNVDSGSVFIYHLIDESWEFKQKIIPSELNHNGGFGGSMSQSNDWIMIGNIDLDDEPLDRKVYFFNEINGVWQNFQSVLSSNWLGEQKFGLSVAIDGSRALVGASQDFLDRGQAYLFEYDGIQWEETEIFEQPFPFEPDYFDQFSQSVGLVGNNILIGSNGYDYLYKNSGLVFQFELEQNDWIFNDFVAPEVGSMYSFSGSTAKVDGQWAAVGAVGYKDSMPNEPDKVPGFVDIYRNIDEKWTHFQRLYDDEFINGFGSSLSLDGSTLAIGYRRTQYKNPVYIYNFNGESWQKTTEIAPDSNENGIWFGKEVSLKNNQLLVGAPYDGESGSAYLFELNNNETWVQKHKFYVENEINANFGVSVGLGNNRVLIGCAGCKDNLGVSTGTAFIFDYDGINWTQSAELLSIGRAHGDAFGSSVVLDGDRALISAERATYYIGPDKYNAGAAYVFELKSHGWGQAQKITSPEPTTDDFFGYSVSLQDNLVVVAGTQKFKQGYAVLHEFNGRTWDFKQYISNPSRDKFGLFGFSVNLSSNHLLIGARGEHENGTYSGSAYMYELKSDLIYCQNFDHRTTCDDLIFISGFNESIVTN